MISLYNSHPNNLKIWLSLEIPLWIISNACQTWFAGVGFSLFARLISSRAGSLHGEFLGRFLVLYQDFSPEGIPRTRADGILALPNISPHSCITLVCPSPHRRLSALEVIRKSPWCSTSPWDLVLNLAGLPVFLLVGFYVPAIAVFP